MVIWISSRAHASSVPLSAHMTITCRMTSSGEKQSYLRQQWKQDIPLAYKVTFHPPAAYQNTACRALCVWGRSQQHEPSLSVALFPAGAWGWPHRQFCQVHWRQAAPTKCSPWTMSCSKQNSNGVKHITQVISPNWTPFCVWRNPYLGGKKVFRMSSVFSLTSSGCSALTLGGGRMFLPGRTCSDKMLFYL